MFQVKVSQIETIYKITFDQLVNSHDGTLATWFLVKVSQI